MKDANVLWVLVALVTMTYTDACGKSRQCPSPDGTKPTITCPSVAPQYTDDKQEYVSNVWWPKLDANDDRDGTIKPTRNGPGPGSRFFKNETITYSARDRAGNVNSCSFDVIVHVVKCPAWSPMKDGWISCDPSHMMLRGTTCRFGCYPGHKLNGDASVTCQFVGSPYGRWSVAAQPVCEKIQCGEEISTEGHTTITCDDANNYRSKCVYACAAGYDILPGRSRVRVCGAQGRWTGARPVCVDTEPPQYTNCPVVITKYADASLSNTTVNWDHLKYTDNAAAGDVTSGQTSGPVSGSVLDVGEYDVTYVAKDRAQNAATCNFKIVVKQINCYNIYPLPYSDVLCPDGRRYGSQCQFSCRSDAVLTGSGTVTCSRRTKGHVKYGEWSFGLVQPHCVLNTTCEKPNAPGNGALACDLWAGGKYCQVLCRDGYVLEAHRSQSFLSCSDRRGTWLGLPEGELLPDCSEFIPFVHGSYKLEQSFYFAGNCVDAKAEIREKFLTAVGQELGDVCQHGKCTVDNVEVICGNSTSRRKRSISTNTTILVISNIKVQSEDGTAVKADTAFNTRSEIVDKFEQLADTGKFTLDTAEGAAVLEGVRMSDAIVTCEDGSYPDAGSMSCVVCLPGYFHDKATNVCKLCPKGNFQSEKGKTSCDVCPHQTTTEKAGAKSASDCLDACDPGFFSRTGVKPCSPCDVGSYTPSYGTTECTGCPGATTTQFLQTRGAVSQAECYAFDLEYYENADTDAVASMTLPKCVNVSDVVISYWVKCSRCDVMLTLSENGTTLLQAEDNGNGLRLSIQGCDYITNHNLSDSGIWKNIVVELLQGDVTVYVNSELQPTSSKCTPNHPVTAQNLDVTAGGDRFVGRISQLNIWSPGEAPSTSFLGNRCFPEEVGDVLSWKRFQDAEGVFVQAKSLCDDEDNCISSPCSNNGTCGDQLGDYLCTCPPGYTGKSCDSNINDCLENSCSNGATCIDGVTRYTCSCTAGFKGDLCEIKVVDGQWASWSPWTGCSVSCNTGTQWRSRACSNPSPDNGGNDCDGDSMESAPCTAAEACHNECAIDPTSIENGKLECYWTDDSNTTRRCNASCNHGYDFDSVNFLDEIVCGPETTYTWNIRNLDNPNAQLPACTAITIAETNVLNYTAEYGGLTSNMIADPDVTETDIVGVVRTITGQIECVVRGRCGVVDVSATNVHSSRSKRSIQSTGFMIQISCSPFTDINECYNLLKTVKEALDAHVQNQSFSLHILQAIYNIDLNSTYISGYSTCRSGTVPVDQYCLPCGLGMYAYQQYCERCPMGFYQDEIGQSGCKQCPDSWTTLGLQTRSALLCNVYVHEGDDPYLTLWYVIVPVCGTTIAAVLLALAVYYRKRKNQNKSKVKPFQEEKQHPYPEIADDNMNTRWRGNVTAVKSAPPDFLLTPELTFNDKYAEAYGPLATITPSNQTYTGFRGDPAPPPAPPLTMTTPQAIDLELERDLSSVNC